VGGRAQGADEVRRLRIAYTAAVRAHANCLRELALASLRGEPPSPTAAAAETKARVQMESARRLLYAAMRTKA
jgi:hypothetical protein